MLFFVQAVTFDFCFSVQLRPFHCHSVAENRALNLLLPWSVSVRLCAFSQFEYVWRTRGFRPPSDHRGSPKNLGLRLGRIGFQQCPEKFEPSIFSFFPLELEISSGLQDLIIFGGRGSRLGSLVRWIWWAVMFQLMQTFLIAYLLN